MQPFLILQVLTLLALANGTPVLATKLLRGRFSSPIDGRVQWVDGRPLFGSSKTVRGIVLSVLVTSACAPLVGLGWRIGMVVAVAAMAGDLCSSFLKRRLRLPAGSQATGLDQVPESLLPLLACAKALSLTSADVAVGVAIFLAGDVLLSRLLYKVHLRDRPY